MYLYNYLATDNHLDPTSIDYDILGLFKKRYFTNNELMKTEYYKNFDGVNYTVLAVKEERVYVRNADGYVLYRDMTISWYLDTNTVGIVKNTRKYYSFAESMSEGITKRSNTLDFLKRDLLFLLMQINSYSISDAEAEASYLLVEQSQNMQLYREGAKQPLKDGVIGSQISLLDYLIPNQNISIRAWLLASL